MNKEEFKRGLEKNSELRRRRANAVVQQTSFKQKRSAVRTFFDKADKKEYRRFKSLPKVLRKAALYGIVLFATWKTVDILPQKINNYPANKEKDSLETPEIKPVSVEEYNNNIKSELEKKYAISDRESFDKLYEASLPLIQMSLFSVEAFALDSYSDRKGASANTAGIGLFYYPVSGDPDDTKWVQTSTYIRKHGTIKETLESAFKGVNGWYRSLDNGAVCDQMYEMLRGAELTPYQFASIATVRYNSKSKGNDICRFVRRNYQNPLACARRIASYPVPENFPGTAKRRMHEAALYLNYGDYVQKMYQSETKLVKRSGGARIYAAPAMNMRSQDVLACRQALSSGNKEAIISSQNRIFQPIRGSQSISDLVKAEISDEQYRDNILKYCFKEEESITLDDAIELAQADEATARKTSKRFGSKAAIALIGNYRSGGR